MRFCSLLALVWVVAAVLVGCAGPEDPAQRTVRQEVQRQLAGNPGYDATETHCTGNPRPWFVEEQASVFICAVRRAEGGGCDWFRATIAESSLRVVLDQPRAGCVLPA